MDIPSFWYAALDATTKELAAELNELGGGDAQAAPIELHCIVDSRRHADESQTVWRLDNAIGLKDIHIAASHYSPRSTLKYYSAANTFDLEAISHKSSNYTPARFVSMIA